MLVGYSEAGNNILEMDFPEKQTLIDVAATISPVSVNAQEILAQIEYSSIFRFPEEIDDTTAKTGNRQESIDDNDGGVTSSNKEKFSIFPNPASQSLTIKVEDNMTGYESNNVIIELYNLLGKKIKSYSIEQETTIVDISKFSEGAYIYKLSIEGIVTKQGIVSVIK